MQQALLGMNLSDVSPADIMSYGWSRDAQQSPSELSNLRTLIREAHTQAREEGKKFIVVSHSWGTVLSYLALAHEYAAGNFYCDLFITLSSPLGTPYALAEYNKPFPNRWEWLGMIFEHFAVLPYTYTWLDNLGVDWDSVNVSLPSNVTWAHNFWLHGDFISGPIPESMGFNNYQLDEENPYPRDWLNVWPRHEYTTLKPGTAIYIQIEAFLNEVITGQ